MKRLITFGSWLSNSNAITRRRPADSSRVIHISQSGASRVACRSGEDRRAPTNRALTEMVRLKVGSNAMHRVEWYQLNVQARVGSELRHRVKALLGAGERRILLNLAGVSGLDAAGVGELVRAYNMATAVNGVLRIANTSGRVREVLVRVGLFDLLRVHSEQAKGDILRLSGGETSIPQPRAS
jgi:anti-anti-sigma factor